MGSSVIRTQNLPPKSEFRFELEPKERLSVRLVPGSGDCNVFGAELVAGTTAERWYTFGDETKACLSTQNGCQVELAGVASTEYVAQEDGVASLYRMNANLHLFLEARRIEARDWLKEDLRRQGTSSVCKTLAQSSAVLNEHSSPIDYEAEPDGQDAVYRSEGQGPRIMIVGPESSGKSSLVKLLANWSLRSPAVCNPAGEDTDKTNEKAQSGSAQQHTDANGWWPCVVSVDPTVGSAPLPSTFSILPLSPVPQASLLSASPVYPYGLTSLTSGSLPPVASAAHGSNVHSLWLGRESVRENERHSHRVVDYLAMALEKRLARDPRARCSGVLIDTPGITPADAKTRYAFLQHCVRALKVDTIVVLGHEKLNIEMQKLFGGAQGTGISVVKLPKSDGAVEVDPSFKERLRSLQVRSYFYGGGGIQKPADTKDGDQNGEGQDEQSAASTLASLVPSHIEPLGGLPSLSPFSTTIPFDLLEVYNVGQDSMAPSSALPIGAARVVKSTQLVKLDPVNSTADQSLLVHSVLALVQPPRGGGGPGVADSKVEPPPTDDEILGATVLGFVHVASIDVARKKMTVLSPIGPGKLPSKTALIGALDWQDS